MRRLYLAAIAYATLGLAGGLFYREITHARDFTGNTQLAVVHTHLLALGLLVMLIVLALDAPSASAAADGSPGSSPPTTSDSSSPRPR